MLTWLVDLINSSLGLDTKSVDLSIWQMGLRAAVIYLAALIMVRLADERRFVGKYAAFDVILSIIFGSTLSRAINGTSAFFESIFAGLVLVVMHWLFSTIAFRYTKFERYIKGEPQVLIKNGRLCHRTMQACHITKEDLVSSLRLKCQTEELTQVQRACLERNGDISFSLEE